MARRAEITVTNVCKFLMCHSKYAGKGTLRLYLQFILDLNTVRKISSAMSYSCDFKLLDQNFQF